ncbi:hypothetical protein A7X67_04880 [Clostridium sp. W14A]|nr:hypothetical protein A7X67_04880 [Clostridium sp. W14A]
MRVKTVHFAVTFFIFVLSCFLFIYLSYTSEVNILSADFKTANAVKFQVKGMTEKSFIEAVEKSGELDHVTLYDVSLENNSIRSLLTYSDSLVPHIIEGRFFTEQDFISSVPKAVVGKNCLSQVYMKNGEKKIKLFGTEYAVVGVMGYKDNYSLNGYIFKNKENIRNHKGTALFLLDSVSGQAVTSAIKELKAHYKINIISEKINNINRAYQYNNFNFVLTLVIALFIAAMAAYTAYLQYVYFYSTIHTFYILGFHRKEIQSFNQKLFLYHGGFCFLIFLAGAGLLFLASERICQLLKFVPLVIFLIILLIGYLVLCGLALGIIFVRWRKKNERMRQK